ncbi:MAG: hypothetical protein WD426_01645 [Anditalea sp.]
MSDKINSNYLEIYSKLFTEKICSGYFGTKKYMDGQEIIKLTPSNQVNLMIIKTLFGTWQEELEKLKSNPYFDYKDFAVNEALGELMNVLSRAIKIERVDFKPMMKEAVQDTILLAVDPVAYFAQEMDTRKPEQIHNYFKESQKYLKWHTPLLSALIEKADLGSSREDLKMALDSHYEQLKGQLEPAETLLSPLDQVHTINYNELLASDGVSAPSKENQETPVLEETAEKEEDENVGEIFSDHQPNEGSYGIDPALAWAKFESEEYSYMKGSIGDLSESVGINQRFMFTDVLFKGNHEQMMQAFKSIDQSESFVDAIELLNQRYVTALNWDIDSEEVGEFLQLIFRKFDQKA